MKIILQILKLKKDFSLTTEFEKTPDAVDLKSVFSQKESEYHLPEYYQTFSDKLGFIKDLSILDVFVTLPESTTYIKKSNSIHTKYIIMKRIIIFNFNYSEIKCIFNGFRI